MCWCYKILKFLKVLKKKKPSLIGLLKIDTTINTLIYFYSFSDVTLTNSGSNKCVLLLKSTL